MRLRAGDEKELKEYKKKANARHPKIELIPLTVEDLEEDLPLGRSDRREPIKASKSSPCPLLR
jgi:hypothetical protein